MFRTTSRRHIASMTNGAGSASAKWVTELDYLLKRRDRDRKRYLDLANNNPDLPKDQAEKIRLVTDLMSKDEEVLELKRIHSLSMQRVQEHQRRTMQQAEEKGVYVEDTINKQVIEYFSGSEHDKKRIREHWMQHRRLRYVFILFKFIGTMSFWWVLSWWYARDPNLVWVENPSKLWKPLIKKSQVGVLGGNVNE